MKDAADEVKLRVLEEAVSVLMLEGCEVDTRSSTMAVSGAVLLPRLVKAGEAIISRAVALCTRLEHAGSRS